MRIAKEDLFLICLLLPLVTGLSLLLSSVRAPHELFTQSFSKPKNKTKKTIEVKSKVEEPKTKPLAMQSLTSALAAPTSSTSGDLKNLTAGLVSEGNGRSGGMNITQADSQPLNLVENAQGKNKPARAVRVVSPEFPQSAQARGIEGFVIVAVTISDKGQVVDAKVVSAEPAGFFEKVAIESVKKWSFEPGIENGKNVSSTIKQKINFKLN